MSSSTRRHATNPCPTDGPVGALLIILACLGAIATFLMMSAIAAMLGAFAPMQSDTVSISPSGASQFAPMPAPEPGHPWMISFLAVALPLLVCSIVFAIGIGIRRGSDWAFKVGIVLFALSTLGGNGASAFSIGLVVYCVLRLLNVIRPRLDAAIVAEFQE
jgi:hypothetical protein